MSDLPTDPERKGRLVFPFNLMWRGVRGFGMRVGGGVGKYCSRIRDKQRSRRSLGASAQLASISSAAWDQSEQSEDWSRSGACAESFPGLLYPGNNSEYPRQNLLAVGTRLWGNWWAGRGLLGIRVYDFALYIDGKEAHERAHSVLVRGGRKSKPDLCTSLRAGDCGSMSVVLRASRDLPLQLLSQEFERILQRRLARVGGNPSDPGLAKFLECFDEQRVPSNVKVGNSVKKGSTITVTRQNDGKLVTSADNLVLGELHSSKLGEALFDLYLGSEPVSKRARSTAAQSLLRIASDPDHCYQPKRSKTCDRPAELPSCVIEQH